MIDTQPITVNLPTLYPKQRAIFFNADRVSVCEASTKAGKSVGGLVWQLDQCLNIRPGMAHLWVEPVHAQAKVMFDRMIRWLTKADPAGRIWNANKSEQVLSFATGSRWFFKGSENYDSIYGSDYGSAVIDEASRCREEVWAAVRSTVTATNGPIRIIGNVKGRKNWSYVLARRAQAGLVGYGYHKLTVHDAVAAGVISGEQVEQARTDLPESVFRELYLAEPSEDGSNPFGLQHIAACIAPMGVGPPMAFGVDLAKSYDFTVVIGMNAAGHVCLFERWQGQSWEHTESRIVGLIGDHPALIDATGVGDPIVERLQRKCPRVEGFKFTSLSKQQLMENLAVCIQQGRIGYPDGPIHQELDTFEYEVGRTGVKYSAPAGLHDDCVCALALACRGQDAAANTAPFMFAFGGADDAPAEEGWH